METCSWIQLLLFVVLAGVQAEGQAPSNNGCASPISVSYGVNPAPPLGASGSTYTNVGATDSVQTTLNDEASCSGGDDTFNKDVWFSFTPTVTGVHRVSTCRPLGFAAGTLEDTVVAVYSAWGSCTSGSVFTEIGCADDDCDFLAEARVMLTACLAGFPSGGLFGFTPYPTEIFSQLGTNAPPFVGLLDGAGGADFGPVVGLPPLTFYGVTLTIDVNCQLIDVSPTSSSSI